MDEEHGRKDRHRLETDLNRLWWRRHWNIGIQGHMSQLQDPIRAYQAEQSPALFKEKLVWIQELWEMGEGWSEKADAYAQAKTGSENPLC